LRLFLSLLFFFNQLSAQNYQSYVKAMARVHTGDNPVPSGMVMNVDSQVSSKTVVYGEENGKKLSGYLATPGKDSTNLPSLLVIHEWWGLNDNIRSMADQLAAEGYVALAVDLYGGSVAETSAEARTKMSAVGKDPMTARKNLQYAFDYLKETSKASKVGVVGWCFGGGWALQTAILLGNRLDACVIYYGRIILDKKKLSLVHAPVLGIFGAEDSGIPLDEVKAFEKTLDTLKKDVTIYVYDGATHAFANPSGRNYQEVPAKDAWAKTLQFFEKYLKSK
jgi:carboxymethylenebutenolidase